MFDIPLFINLVISLIEIKNIRWKHPIKEDAFIYLLTYLFL